MNKFKNGHLVKQCENCDGWKVETIGTYYYSAGRYYLTHECRNCAWTKKGVAYDGDFNTECLSSMNHNR
jgi:hypothetical protein